MATRLPPPPATPGGRRRTADGAGRGRAPGRGPRAVGALNPPGLGPTHHRPAMDVPTHPRHPTRHRERETQTTDRPADKWALNYTAGKEYYQREGHLQVPSKHTERIIVGGDGNGDSGEDQEERELKLGAWISNQRSRAATLSPERMEQLSNIGMRWA
ncbi:helicase associated domain-containing protein [Streptomyces paradoxus]|uniref:helicase associated domain-containing protein n=1 Tax=Streptomyces paradoxus TaxID=66375 RepID=UPI00380A8BB8